MRAIWLALAVAAACGKSDKSDDNGPKPGPSGTGARDAVIAAWKNGGLAVTAFAPASTAIGKDCAAGTVAKLDVLVCGFDSPDDASKAADSGLQWIGDTTGSSQARGSLVIAVADRHKADPHGKTIKQIFDLASK